MSEKPRLLSAAYARRVGAVVKRVESTPRSQHNYRTRPRDIPETTFPGVVVSAGVHPETGNEVPNFEDHRYWVQVGIPTSVSPYDWTAPTMFEVLPHHWREVVILPVTNIAEHWTRGHLLPHGTPVQIHVAYDGGRPPDFVPQARYWMNAVPPRPFLWVNIQAAVATVAVGCWHYAGFGAPGPTETARIINPFYNRIEVDRGGTLHGNGVDRAGLDTDTFTFEIQPIPTGISVACYPEYALNTTSGVYETAWWCQYENGVDGGCD